MPKLDTEFMPNLNEGTPLYMPTTLPGISVTKAAELMQMQDRIIRSFPEVASVCGKAGRASTSTDPAPTEMFAVGHLRLCGHPRPRSRWLCRRRRAGGACQHPVCKNISNGQWHG